MKEMFLSMLEDCKVGDAYKVNYFKEQRMVKVSDEDMEAIIDCAIKLMEEVKRLGERGILTKKIIQERISGFGDKKSTQSRTFNNVILGFAEGGIYDIEIFHQVAKEVGRLVGYEVDSSYWKLIGRTSVLSSMVSVIEGYFINEGMEQIYENCIWIYIRSCLYMKSKVEGDQYES